MGIQHCFVGIEHNKIHQRHKMMTEVHSRAPLSKISRIAALFLIVSSVTSFVLVPSRSFTSQNTISTLSAKKKNDWSDAKAIQEFCAEQEARATAATESWIVDATGFLEPEQSSALIEKLQERADVDCLSVGSYRGDSSSKRVRCVYCNPDLGYDESTADSDYVYYLKMTMSPYRSAILGPIFWSRSASL